jgi:hypothetical protein
MGRNSRQHSGCSDPGATPGLPDPHGAHGVRNRSKTRILQIGADKAIGIIVNLIFLFSAPLPVAEDNGDLPISVVTMASTGSVFPIAQSVCPNG